MPEVVLGSESNVKRSLSKSIGVGLPPRSKQCLVKVQARGDINQPSGGSVIAQSTESRATGFDRV